jgi:hypothetical protein
MKIGELVYLVHPYRTYGNPEENKVDAAAIAYAIRKEYGWAVIDPINTTSMVTDHEGEAMLLCKRLYDACTVVVLSPNWHKSVHCRQEATWALFDGKPMYTTADGTYLAEIHPREVESRLPQAPAGCAGGVCHE